MSLDWEPWALAQIEGGGVRPAIVLRAATDPPIRVWSGAIRDIALPADTIETEEGAVYQSMGYLTEIPAFSQMLNGQAERVDFGLAGTAITGELAAIASTEAADIRDVEVNVGLLVFDANWQEMSPVAWLGAFIADSLGIDRQGAMEGQTRSVKLSTGSLMTGRRRPRIAYWTDPDQKRRSATDMFFEFVRQYSISTTKVWPK